MLNGIIVGSVIAIGALSVTLIYGLLRIVNFAQGDYITFGAYVALVINVTWSRSLFEAVIGAALMTALLAVAFEFALWRPLRRRRTSFIAFFVPSVGLALILRNAISLIAGSEFRIYEWDQLAVYELFDLRFSAAQVITIATGVAVVTAMGLMLARTSLGRAMRAVSDDATLASIAGVNVNRLIVYTWVLSGMLAGVAGVLQGLLQNSFDPNIGFNMLLPIFAAVILGGLGSAYGALAGGLTLGVVMETSTWAALPGGGVDPTYKVAVAFGAMILVLLIRPNGVFGHLRQT